MKISNSYKKLSEIYKLFCNYPNSDFSDKALMDMYLYESRGTKNGVIENQIKGIFSTDNTINGYCYGKWKMDFHISEWLMGIKEGILFKNELYKDGKYPKWWLDKILKGVCIQNEDIKNSIINEVKARLKMLAELGNDNKITERIEFT